MPVFDPAAAEALRGAQRPLLAWYGRCRREMPWRGCGSSYFVWISEIMLQQTRVEAVRAYFARFVAALPTVRDLAECDEGALLKLWEGLGYYNRARNLQKAARVVVERYGGELPRSYEALLGLPGVGEYTAGAVASIAYGIPVPCVDGNVMRVLSRLTASPADVSLPAVKREHRALAQALLDGLPAAMGREDPADVADFNQALMELGALVCVPNGPPLCGECPLRERCAAARAGNPSAYPVKPAKAARRVENRTVLVLLCCGQALLRRRPGRGLLAGLWELPNEEGWLTRAQAADWLAARGLAAPRLYPLKPASHVFSHIEWRMQGFLARPEAPAPVEGCEWVPLPDLRERYALPNAFRAYSAALEQWADADAGL